MNAEVKELMEENIELKAKLEKIKDIIQTCNQLNNCDKCPYCQKCLVIDNSQGDYFNTDKLIIDIIEGAEE